VTPADIERWAEELARVLATPEGQARMKAAADETRRRCEELRRACRVDPRILLKQVTPLR